VRLQSVIDAMERLAPSKLAEPWDNVGLIVGDPAQPVSHAMLCIDYTPLVAEEARQAKCDCVIAYHPPLFEPVKRVLAAGATSLVYDAVRRGVALYSPHTALDAADGGTNDVLADAIALADRRPLKLRDPRPTHYKLVMFVPHEAVDRVSAAVFDAGAGVIGDYRECSFRTAGQGTFFGSAGTQPTVGQAGRREQVDEMKIETLVPMAQAEAVVTAMRKAHPYEEPAFDLQALAPSPEVVGLGRVGKVAGDATIDMLLNMLRRALGVTRLLVAGEPGRVARRAAVCAGACGGDLLSEAIAEKVDLYVTGEMRHHDALRAVRENVTVVCTLHSNSERATLARVATRLTEALPTLRVTRSRQDRDPFEIV
jgi:dinuclear metal center YbgI/SA1388 family protein